MTNMLSRKKKYGDDLCKKSLNMFPLEGAFRNKVLVIVETALFDRIVLLLILLNSLCMALYNHRDKEAQVNKNIDTFEPLFIGAFLIECIFKVIAYGFIMSKKTYLRDPWNWLDFIVVVTGTFQFIMERTSTEGGTNLGFLRVFRVMRPLRSLTTLPELKMLVNTVLSSVPRLINVILMTVFLLTICGILGMNFWQGIFERRCRMQKNPLYNAKNDCWSWPLTLNEGGDPLGRPCGGRYMCQDQATGIYCGSNSIYDLKPEFRPQFPSTISYTDPKTAKPVTRTFNTADDHLEAFEFAKGGTNGWCDDANPATELDGNYNYGKTHFNHFLNACLVIFQCLTLEGWTDVMYMCQDAHDDIFAFFYFLAVVLLGSFFLINVALAVVWEAFQELSQKNAAATKPANTKYVPEETSSEDDKSPASMGIARSASTSNEKLTAQLAALGQQSSSAKIAPEMICQRAATMRRRGRKDAALLVFEDEVINRTCFNVVKTTPFQFFINLCIFCSVVVMMMDKYPPVKPPLVDILELLNIIFTTIFAVELVCVHLAIGPKKYWTTSWHFFDGIIVITSIIELAMGGGAVKTLRILRIFKLAKKWQSFRMLMSAVVHTVMSMGNFTVLLILMIFVFALMGMEFFARTLTFEPATTGSASAAGDGTELLKVVEYMDKYGDRTGKCTPGDPRGDYWCVPRANFDTFLWAVVTVFQILTGENWNAVMYDGMRGAGWGFFVYFFALVGVGQWIIFNLFLAILMANFQEASDTIRESEEILARLAAELPEESDIEEDKIEEDAEVGKADTILEGYNNLRYNPEHDKKIRQQAEAIVESKGYHVEHKEHTTIHKDELLKRHCKKVQTKGGFSQTNKQVKSGRNTGS